MSKITRENAFPYDALSEVYAKNRDYMHFIAASLSHVPEEYLDAVAEYVFWYITRKARELRHRPKHPFEPQREEE